VAALDALKGPINALQEQIVGSTLVLLNGERAPVRSEETNLGDLTCEAIMQFAANHTGLFKDPTWQPVCLINGGTFR